MNLTVAGWYPCLCGLFILAEMASATTVVLPAQRAHDILLAAMMAAAFFFGAVFLLAAILFQRRKVDEPKWLLRLAQIAAVLATCFVLYLARR